MLMFYVLTLIFDSFQCNLSAIAESILDVNTSEITFQPCLS